MQRAPELFKLFIQCLLLLQAYETTDRVPHEAAEAGVARPATQGLEAVRGRTYSNI
jgi:hypothetical protein